MPTRCFGEPHFASTLPISYLDNSPFHQFPFHVFSPAYHTHSPLSPKGLSFSRPLQNPFEQKMASNNVRIIARVRPLIKGETEKDIVVLTSGDTISMPNPKNENESFSFPFHSVRGQDSDQAQLFSEVSPTLKHLFKGNDVTIFAYGATGSGKTYTMRGQKAATERGIIPRLLTAIYRRGKELEKKTDGGTTIRAIMTYYEIYNVWAEIITPFFF